MAKRSVFSGESVIASSVVDDVLVAVSVWQGLFDYEKLQPVQRIFIHAVKRWLRPNHKKKARKDM